jgi:membrane-bound ClpP family serine protease
MAKIIDNKEDGRMAMSPKGLKLLLIGLVVMILGYALLAGGNSNDPEVFSYDIFDFQRLVLAPIVIIGGIVIEVVAIMKVFKSK